MPRRPGNGLARRCPAQTLEITTPFMQCSGVVEGFLGNTDFSHVAIKQLKAKPKALRCDLEVVQVIMTLVSIDGGGF